MLRTERYYGTVYRSFTLPSELDEANSEAKYENGVLELQAGEEAGRRGPQLQVQ